MLDIGCGKEATMKKRKTIKSSVVSIDMVRDAQDALSKALVKDVKYSIEPDPDGRLKLTEDQKNFIRSYLEFRNIPLAAQMAEIDEVIAKRYFMDPTIRLELRRINLALYYRKFSRRLLSIDELGGYLTSLLIDEDVGEADRLTGKDKLQAAKLIMDLNKMKAEAYKNPRIIENVDYEEQIQDLSPEQLRQLIQSTMSNSREAKEARQQLDDEKEALIREINSGDYLDPSELAYLKSCTIEELKQLRDGTKNDS